MIHYSICAVANLIEPVMWMKVFEKRYGRKYTNQLYYFWGGFTLYAVYMITQMMSVFLVSDKMNIIATIIRIYFVYEIVRILYTSRPLERLVSIGILVAFAMTLDFIKILILNSFLSYDFKEIMQIGTIQAVCMLIQSCCELILLSIYLSERGEKFLRRVLSCKKLIPFILINGIINIPSWIIYNNLELVNNNIQIIQWIQNGTFFRLFLLQAGSTLFAIMTISKLKIKETNYQLKMQQMKTELEMYDQISELTQDLRTLRHDMRGNIGIIKGLYESGEYEKIGEYLSQIYKIIEPTDDLVLVSNKIVSIALSQKCKIARQEGIKISSKIMVEDYGMDDLDICSLLSNILDNAIESTKKCPVGERYIDFTIMEEGEGYTIRCENPYLESPVMSKNNFVTSKKNAEKHGFGISIIRRLAKKYGGRVRIFPEMGMFIVEVYIPKINEEAC